MNVILLGYRGSGKTTAGQSLADQLDMSFVDIDTEICRQFGGRTVAEIWETDGEPKYRQVEVEVTEKACSGDNQVIALGGGTIMQPGAKAAVLQDSDTVRIYLKAQPAELDHRINSDQRNVGLRPSLGQFKDSLEEVTHMLGLREPTYLEAADEVIEVDALDPEQVVNELLRIVKKRNA